MVSFGQLYGGKICAALDRQHPRDLFDIKLLLENEGLSDEIKQGFIYGLLSCDRPIYELLNPNLIDQSELLETHFSGMTAFPFTYPEFDAIRLELIRQILAKLSPEDREFILGFNGLKPDWSRYPFEHFPSVKWKMLNLEALKQEDFDKYESQHEELKAVLA